MFLTQEEINCIIKRPCILLKMLKTYVKLFLFRNRASRMNLTILMILQHILSFMIIIHPLVSAAIFQIKKVIHILSDV